MAKSRRPKYRLRYIDVPYNERTGLNLGPVLTMDTFGSQRAARAYADKHLTDCTPVEIVIPFEVVKRLR